MVFDRLRGYLERDALEESGLSAYGKLPQYGDFIRHGLSSRPAAAFKSWLDRGISRFWEGDRRYSGHRIGAHAILLTFPDDAARVYGYLWGSHDAAGLRSFPFVVFLALRAEGAPGLSLARLELLERVVDLAASLRPELEMASEVEEILAAVSRPRVSLEVALDGEARKELAQRLGRITLGEFAESLYGADWERPWLGLLRYLARRAEAQAGPLSVRLPSSELLPLASQVGFWAVFLQSGLLGSREVLQLVYQVESDGIVLLRREPKYEDVRAFHPEMPGHELIEDLRQAIPAAREEAEESEKRGSASTPLVSVLEQGLEGLLGSG